MVTLGLFHLVNPPTAGHVGQLREAITTTEFPWHRLLPGMRRRKVEHITVQWGHAGSYHAVYLAGSATIELSTTMGVDNQRVMFLHEVGHAVDDLSLTWEQRNRIIDLFHSCRGRYTGADNGAGGKAQFDHTNPHSEDWRGVMNEYQFRHMEAFAEAFVASFNPTLWPKYNDLDPRFGHWPINYDEKNHQPDGIYYDEFRRITLEHPIMAFTDVPEDHPHREGIEWAAGQGLVKGQPDGTFNPEKAVSRAQLCTILHRQSQAG